MSVGSTIKQGSYKVVAKASAAFKPKDKTDTKSTEADASAKQSQSSLAALSFSTKLRAARDGFTASFKRATSKSPTAERDTPAATLAVDATTEPTPSDASKPSSEELESQSPDSNE